MFWGMAGAFWLVLAVAVAVGGQEAASGLPRLAEAVAPKGLMAAQARDSDANIVAFALREAAPASGYAPQVLQPVRAHDMPAWVTEASTDEAAPARPNGHLHGASIALVIDDLGADVSATRAAIALPKTVTLSFLPYPATTAQLALAAAAAGHEVLAHVPMEPEGAHDAGPMALREGLSPDEIRARLDWALARVPGAIGINNHEGSRFTADRASLIPVAEALADRHLFFLDSRTTADTAVVSVARAFGTASAGRDIFLDDVQTPEAVAAQLAALESRAREYGIAIAIGHPHEATLAVLAAWTATAAQRGFRLVPASVAIRLKTENDLLNPPVTLAQAARR